MEEVYSYEEAFEESLKYFNNDELAVKVFLDKYALKNEKGELLEDSPSKMHRRLAKEFARIELQNYPGKDFINSEDELESKFDCPLSEEFIYQLFDRFKYLIPQGSPMSGIGNNYQIQSLGNCFTLGEHPYDSYGGILYADQMLVQLAKRRCGVGLNLDKIRPKGLPTKNAAGTTDGISVFMERFSNSTREVAQSGRRGALLQGLSVHHPEIETFINIKRDLKRVTGANISILFTDEFMKAVENDTEYEQRWPVDSKNPQISKMMSARKIWDAFIDASWSTAEPGALFVDRARNYGLSHQYGVIDERFKDVITNPCMTGDTLLLIKGKNGYPRNRKIGNLVGQNVEVWNGEEWSEVVIRNNGQQNILRISLENGMRLKCSEKHVFILNDGSRVFAKNLIVGDQLCNYIEPHTGIEFFSDGDLKYHKIEKIVKCKKEEVFCFTEHKLGRAVFNNILTGQCGEIWIGFDSCRLFLQNLFSYVENPFTKNAKFNYKLYDRHAQIAQRLNDDMVDLEIEKMDMIINKIDSDPELEQIKACEKDMWISYKETAILGRRTGLGVTGLGDCLAALNIKYGTDESIKETEKIYKTLALSSMKSSCLMAKINGPFKLYDNKIEEENPFLKLVYKSSKEVKELHEKYGRRNISLTTTAPAGSVSILTQTTSGIEPPYLLEYTRRRKIREENKKADFVDELGDRWEENLVRHHHLQTWMNINNSDKIEDSPYYQATSNDIDWEKSVDIQAAAQKWITHSISKTCNLPNDVSKDLVAKVYIDAWKKGLKGFTVYRDGCRSGVLVSNTKDNKINHNDAAKRPKELECDVYHISRNKQPYIILVGLLDGKPYEVFAISNNNDTVDNKVKKGKIIKLKRSKYRAEFEDDTELSPISAFTDNQEDIITRLVSTSLRHNTPIEFIQHQLEKTKGDLNSLARCISRALKNYIADGTEIKGEECPDCGSKLIRAEGCRKCSQCQYSVC